MQKLECTVSDGLWRLLQDRSAETGEPLNLIISKALADYFGSAHHTLYQVSTSAALVEGIYQGAVRVGTLRQHGNLGLGTFEALDGEMVILDGHAFQIRGDGSVYEADDDALSPFAAVTTFAPGLNADLESCASYAQLLETLDRMRDSDNIFYAIRVDGVFDKMHTRAVTRADKGVTLVQAAAVQPEFHFNDVAGSLVGFWTPQYAKTLNVAGYHLHFLSDDRSMGGHVLGCSGSKMRLQLQRDSLVRIALPETEDFLKADLRRDPSAALIQAEGAKS